MGNLHSSWPTKRLKLIQALNKNLVGLNAQRVDECKEAVRRSYQTSTPIPKIATVFHETNVETTGFRSIGLRSAIDIYRFNDPTYIWRPYFSDIGRAIASGEQKYIQQQIIRKVKANTETISHSKPDFRILSDCIKYLQKNNLDPDTLIAPIPVFVDFMKFYQSNLEWPPDHAEQLTIEDTKLKVFWAHKYARMRNFLVFNSKAGIWHVIPDQGTDYLLTIAIGKPAEQIGKVEYWVETIVRYQIIDQRAFCRIKLSK